MRKPEGLSNDNDGLVCKLNKAIYGLKQAAYCWNSSLDDCLKNLGFIKTNSDSCLYYKLTDNIKCFIGLYVDDMIIACNSDSYLKKLKEDLSSKYKIKDLGKVDQFLGVKVIQNEDGIFIHQSTFIKSLLQKFNFENCKANPTPMDANVQFEYSKDDDVLTDKKIYQSAIGALLYLSTRTRPDISFAVSKLSRYCSKPNNAHWNAVKRIFRYLKGTINLGLNYVKQGVSTCIAYSDADWGGDKGSRKSTSGYCFFLGKGLISWRSNKQNCIALSSAESEYIGLSGASQEAVWIKKLLTELKLTNVNDKILIYGDNLSSINLTKSNVIHAKSKHIDLKTHYIRDVINKGIIDVEYVPSADNIADIFTKALAKERFRRLRMMLGVMEFES